MTLIGLCRQPFQVDDYLNDIVFKSITLHTVHGRRIFDTWENCEKLVADGTYIFIVCISYLFVILQIHIRMHFSLNCIGKVKPSLIVSHQFNMNDHKNAFDVLMSGNGCKIVVDPQNRLCPK